VLSPGDAELAGRRIPVSPAWRRRPFLPPLLITLTDQWLTDHTLLTRQSYPGLGHDVDEDEGLTSSPSSTVRSPDSTVANHGSGRALDAPITESSQGCRVGASDG
jgi:hypothetical protein